MLKLLAKLHDRITWKILKSINDDEKLWRALHSRSQIKDSGEIKPGFFKDKNGLSCDLASYTTVKRALLGIQSPPRPKFSGLVEFSVASVRDPKVNSDVIHKPIALNGRKNYAHCQLTTLLTTSQARKLGSFSKFKINPDVEKIRGN